MKTKQILLMMAFFIAICGLWAAPQSINFQGVLKDANGEPVNDSKFMEFRIYNSITGGSALWTEQHSSVTISNGIFSVQLGIIAPFANNLLDNSDLFITYLLGGESIEMSPRQKLNSVPYSIRSTKADTAVMAENSLNIGGVPLSSLVQQDSLGNVGVSGVITANSFVGDGSGLTGMTTTYDTLYVHKSRADTMTANTSGATLTISNSGQYGNVIHIKKLSNNINDNAIKIDSTSCGVYVERSSGNAFWVNSADIGLNISSADVGVSAFLCEIGFSISNCARNGLDVGHTGKNGVFVALADSSGINVYLVGSPSEHHPSDTKSGFIVEGVKGHGLFVGYAEADGVHINKTLLDGVRVHNAGHNGFLVDYAAGNGVKVDSTLFDGLLINNAGCRGVNVNSAINDGVYANTANSNGEYGLYTPDKIYGSNLTTRTINNIGLNVGNESLEAGDIVCLSGYENNVLGNSDIPIIKITKANGNNSQAVIGVVEYKVHIKEEIEDEGKRVTKSFRYAKGNATKGDYVSIIVLGPANVKIKSKENIKTGELLTAENGLAKKTKVVEFEGITVAENVGILGKALENSNGKDKIKVYVNCK